MSEIDEVRISTDLAMFLGRLDSKVDQLVQSSKDREERLKEIDRRLTEVEKFNVRVLTVAAIGVPMMTVAAQWFTNTIFGF